MYAAPIEAVIERLSKLPSVGRRTAERFVFHLLKSGKKDVGELTLALKTMMDNVMSCAECFDFSDQSPCPICNDPARHTKTLCVVAESQDVQAIQTAAAYQGRYHVLRGTIKSDDERSIAKITARELFMRIKSGQFNEVILALSPDMRGETTMLFLEHHIKKTFPHITVSRLARGLPIGSDVQYADTVTLQSAFNHRTS
jgi:recombination protein RecR